MTLRTLTLTSVFATATATAFGAYAQGDAPGHEPTEGVPTLDETHEVPAATITEGGVLMAPRVPLIDPEDQGEVDRTSVDKIIAIAEDGATVRSVDNEVIGTVVGHDGDGGPDHMFYVDTHADANIAAERLGFEAGSLRVKRVGEGLQYDYTLAQLREAVVARVAEMTQ